MLSQEDKNFIKLINKGYNHSKAFRMAYPDNPSVKRYVDAVKNDDKPTRRLASLAVTDGAKSKLQTKHISRAMQVYQTKMEEFSDLAVDTAIELVQSAKSEKVRADLAIEGMRQRVGTPVQKVSVKEDKEVVITFGTPKEEIIDLDDIEEGEIIEG